MTRSVNRLVYWTPRFLGIAFAVFLSMFALDVFGEGGGFWRTALALAMHLIPTAMVLAALALAWRWEWTGGVLFTALGITYIAMFWGRFPWPTYAAIAGPLFVIGALFLIAWRYRGRPSTAS